MSFDYAGRIRRFQALMTETGIDVALLSVGSTFPDVTGYEAQSSERLTVLVVPAAGVPTLFVPELESVRVRPGDFDLRAWSELDDPVAMATSVVATPRSVAVGDHMWSVFLTRFQKHWTGADWTPASDITTRLRMRKDAEEVEILRMAAHAVDRVMARLPTEIRFSGRTEVDVARDLAAMTVEEGHDVADFTIVASGPNGASPHHHPGSRRIEDGDMVVCDYGGRLAGYYSDSTRTFCVGEPTEEQSEVHAVVMSANGAGRDAARPGTRCQEIDQAARDVIARAGMAGFFIHRTGHGIGLEVHEHPYMVEGNDMPLETGMTFSVEPGIYVPDRFGVRIEDIVVCTETGVESLNTAARGLMTVS